MHMYILVSYTLNVIFIFLYPTLIPRYAMSMFLLIHRIYVHGMKPSKDVCFFFLIRNKVKMYVFSNTFLVWEILITPPIVLKIISSQKKKKYTDEQHTPYFFL